MGAIAPIPIRESIKDEIKEKIIEPTLRGMKKEGLAYTGVLTLSIIISKEGPVLVDYHVRLNDPATQAMVPIIKTDIIEIMEAMKENRISSINLELNNLSTVAVVLASYGYPLNPEIGNEVTGLTNGFLMNIEKKPLVFIGALKKTPDGHYFTYGGRCITVVGRARSLEEANFQVYELLKKKKLSSLWYREDIGTKFMNQ